MFDLHFHSTYSDGKLTVPKLAEIIRGKKFTHCSLTDHNTIDGVYELGNCLDGSGTKVIYGTELTAKYHENEVHLLAYDFALDEAQKILDERNEIIRDQKRDEMTLAIQLFRQEGFVVDEHLQPNEKQPVGYTIALNMYSKPANQNLLRERHSKVLEREEFFNIYQAESKSCATKHSGVTLEWLVKKFNGVAQDLIIAHPFVSVSFVMKPLNEDEISDILNMGVTGVEVYHEHTSPPQIELLQRLMRERKLHYTGGSDFHGKENDMPLGYFDGENIVPDFHLTNHHNQILS